MSHQAYVPNYRAWLTYIRMTIVLSRKLLAKMLIDFAQDAAISAEITVERMTIFICNAYINAVQLYEKLYILITQLIYYAQFIRKC